MNKRFNPGAGLAGLLAGSSLILAACVGGGGGSPLESPTALPTASAPVAISPGSEASPSIELTTSPAPTSTSAPSAAPSAPAIPAAGVGPAARRAAGHRDGQRPYAPPARRVGAEVDPAQHVLADRRELGPDSARAGWSGRLFRCRDDLVHPRFRMRDGHASIPRRWTWAGDPDRLPDELR